MENDKVPTGLILYRQGMKDLPAVSSSRYQDALEAEKGGYTIKDVENPDVVLIANGSEVATLIEGAKLLEERENIKAVCY